MRRWCSRSAAKGVLLPLLLVLGSSPQVVAAPGAKGEAPDTSIGGVVQDQTFLLPPVHPGVDRALAEQASALLEQRLQRNAALKLTSYRDVEAAQSHKTQQQALGACQDGADCYDAIIDDSNPG